MNEDAYRSAIRAALAELVEDISDGPDYEDLVPVHRASARTDRHVPGRLVVFAAGFAIALVAILPIALRSPSGSVVTSPLDVSAASEQAEQWWSAVAAGDFPSARSQAHPEAEFNYTALLDFMNAAGRPVAVSVAMDEFGADALPQLCFALRGGQARLTGSVVFKLDGDTWLVWEVRMGTMQCTDAPHTTTTLTPSS